MIVYIGLLQKTIVGLKIKTIILLLPVLIVFVYIGLLSLLHMPTFSWVPWDHLGAWDHLGPGLRSSFLYIPCLTWTINSKAVVVLVPAYLSSPIAYAIQQQHKPLTS